MVVHVMTVSTYRPWKGGASSSRLLPTAMKPTAFLRGIADLTIAMAWLRLVGVRQPDFIEPQWDKRAYIAVIGSTFMPHV